MKKTRIIFITLFFITILLSVLHVVVANMLSTTGVDLYKMQADLTKYKKENLLLREHVLASSSLSHIASKAADLGFVKPKAPLVIPKHVPLAKR